MGLYRDQFLGYAKYNCLFNEKLYSAAAELSDEERKKDMGAFFDSIHGTLNHILLADRIWLGRFSRLFAAFESLRDAELVHEFDSLRQELCGDFQKLSSERHKTDHLILSWVEELSDEVLAETMRYTNSLGETHEHPLWVAVSHMFNHQTHHRGQITTLLSQLGKDPGVTDYLAYVSLPGA